MKINIDNVLKQQNKTRYWLAKQTNMTYQSVMKLCNNKTTSIQFDIIEKICIALNCTPNDIFIIEKPTL